MRLTLLTFHSAAESYTIPSVVLSGRQKGSEGQASRIPGHESGIWLCESESLNLSGSVSTCAKWGQPQPQQPLDLSQPQWAPKCVEAWILKTSSESQLRHLNQCLSVPAFYGWEIWGTKKPRALSKMTEPFFTRRPLEIPAAFCQSLICDDFLYSF